MTPLRILVLLKFLADTLVADVVCEQTTDFIVITRNGNHVLTYNKTGAVPDGVDPKYARSGFIHPISTPSGRILTDGYPLPHHTHQHGLFFAWKRATFEGEAVNFWEHTPTGATVRHNAVLDVTNENNFAGFRVRLDHAQSNKVILREIWTVRVDADTGLIDFTSEQACATESPLTIERYHYGGMAIRGARAWFDTSFETAQGTSTPVGAGANVEIRAPYEMLTSKGHTRATGNHTRPEWVCMTGSIDEQPVSITLVPHPTNFRYPQHVRLHPGMPYFCFMPAVEKGFSIEPGKPFVSRYRIVAEDGKPDPARFDRVQAAFASER